MDLETTRERLESRLKASKATSWPLANLGGVSVLKNKDIGVNNHYFIQGYYFQFSFFFTCYHYVNFYFGLIEKGVALLIVPDYLLFHTL
jgi:hypothetical protein